MNFDTTILQYGLILIAEVNSKLKKVIKMNSNICINLCRNQN